MKISGGIFLLFFFLHAGRGAAQAPWGLRLPSDTVGVAAYRYALPPLSLLPAGRDPGSAARPREALSAPEMPAACAFDQLGTFCKWEVKLEKAARMPVKFRLGEVQYVERMEGKLPDY